MFYDSPLSTAMARETFHSSFSSVMDAIMARSTTLVACSPGDKDLIFAFMVFEPTLLHFTFCKEAFRRLGITLSLFTEAFGAKDAAVTITHWTTFLRQIYPSHTHLTYNPFPLYRQGEQ